MKNLILIASWSILISLFSCNKDKALKPLEPTPCDSVTVSFSAEIQPMFMASCAYGSCHNSTSAVAGYILESYSQISQSAEISYNTMKQEDSKYTPMPYYLPKLNDSLINKLNCWIEAGKPNN